MIQTARYHIIKLCFFIALLLMQSGGKLPPTLFIDKQLFRAEYSVATKTNTDKQVAERVTVEIVLSFD
jgi:hypothetical protein